MPSISNPGPRIVVAVDLPSRVQALELADRLDPSLCRLKIGKESFTRSGPALVEELQRRGFEIFLDLKFHDIPNTVASACRAAAELGVWMVNVHASGGRRMMEAAADAVSGFKRRPLLIAVTILTSLSEPELEEVGFTAGLAATVNRLSTLTQASGLDGVVCSPWEAAALRRNLGDNFVLVTPGVRPTGSSVDDQHRIMTPREAIDQGASYLVVGRPITRAEHPEAVLRAIASEIA